ncbi:hypothetical protein J6590_030272 [Homalodisca vitripennis]|nr:hypothetical protein J6590_030272 [Homalodisca vitripennis]
MSCPSAWQATASGPRYFAVQLLGTTGGLANYTSGSASSGRSFTGSTGVRSNNLQQSLAMEKGGDNWLQGNPHLFRAKGNFTKSNEFSSE